MGTAPWLPRALPASVGRLPLTLQPCLKLAYFCAYPGMGRVSLSLDHLLSESVRSPRHHPTPTCSVSSSLQAPPLFFPCFQLYPAHRLLLC